MWSKSRHEKADVPTRRFFINQQINTTIVFYDVNTTLYSMISHFDFNAPLLITQDLKLIKDSKPEQKTLK